MTGTFPTQTFVIKKFAVGKISVVRSPTRNGKGAIRRKSPKSTRSTLTLCSVMIVSPEAARLEELDKGFPIIMAALEQARLSISYFAHPVVLS